MGSFNEAIEEQDDGMIHEERCEGDDVARLWSRSSDAVCLYRIPFWWTSKAQNRVTHGMKPVRIIQEHCTG